MPSYDPGMLPGTRGALAGFSYFDFNKDAPYLRVFEDGVQFSEGVTDALGYPDKCIFLVHDSTKRCAIQAVDLEDTRGVSYYEEDDMPDSPVITWSNKRLAQRVADLGGLDLTKSDYIVSGYPMLDEDAVMFDLHSAKPVDKNSAQHS